MSTRTNIDKLKELDEEYPSFGFEPRVAAFPGIVLFFECIYEGIVH